MALLVGFFQQFNLFVVRQNIPLCRVLCQIIGVGQLVFRSVRLPVFVTDFVLGAIDAKIAVRMRQRAFVFGLLPRRPRKLHVLLILVGLERIIHLVIRGIGAHALRVKQHLRQRVFTGHVLGLELSKLFVETQLQIGDLIAILKDQRSTFSFGLRFVVLYSVNLIPQFRNLIVGILQQTALLVHGLDFFVCLRTFILGQVATQHFAVSAGFRDRLLQLTDKRLVVRIRTGNVIRIRRINRKAFVECIQRCLERVIPVSNSHQQLPGIASILIVQVFQALRRYAQARAQPDEHIVGGLVVL